MTTRCIGAFNYRRAAQGTLAHHIPTAARCRTNTLWEEVPHRNVQGGHVFSASGMAPDQQNVQAVTLWPTPENVTAVGRFLGLASYYLRYIAQFSDIAKPLHNLIQKNVPFHWTQDCEKAFHTLKEKLEQALVLTYPKFDSSAGTFILQTDASAVGLGAELEQDGHVVAYASRALTKPEQQYSVIHKECLAAVYAMKQFRHYLLGRRFKLVTDHAPLQWLSAQKMEGLLCRRLCQSRNMTLRFSTRRDQC